jgi:diguanylate cyclase (GGDEF)-like protein
VGGAVTLDLTLAPLSDRAAADQLAALLPSLSRVPGLSDLLVARCEGNPFVVEEYLRAIVDAGLLRPSWGTWLLDEHGLDHLHLPHDILGLVLARVDGLSPAARALLVTASAVGNRFDAHLVAAVHGVSDEAAVSALGEAAGKRLLGQRLGGGFRFTHDRIREALLSGLTPSERARLHVRIADALQEELPGDTSEEHRAAAPVYAVARHYIEGLTRAEEESADRVPADLSARAGLTARAFAVCRRAGVLALGNHAPAEAVWFLEQATRFQPEPGAEFLHLLGQAHRQAGQLPEARARLEQALAADAEPLERAEILSLLAGVHLAGWDTEAATSTAEAGLAEAGARLPRGVRLVLGTLVLFGLAQLSAVTRLGFGSARGDRRRRAEAIAGLHEVGAYAGSLSMRPGRLLTHTVRALYWGTRIGSGRRYAHTQAAYGLLCSALGLKGAAARAFRRAGADPADQLPTVRAKTVMYQETSAYFSGLDDGQGLVATVASHGQWWDVGTFVDTCGLLTAEACAQGRTGQAAHLVGLTERRLAGRPEVPSFPPNRVMLRAIQGRVAEAGAELQRIREEHRGRSATELVLLRLLATFFVLHEEGEHGSSFEAAVAEFAGLGLNQAQLARNFRVIYFQIALGRLEQVRAADTTHRPARLAAAREAVRRVAAAPKLELLRAQALLTRADLEVLEGEPDEALETLGGLPPYFGADSPNLSWHAARIRARALLAAGAAAEAERQARLAASIAMSEGWAHRVRMVAAEFGRVAVQGAESSRTTGPGTGFAGTAGLGPTASPAGADRQRLEALQQVSAAAALVFDPGELARITLDEIVRILAADRAFLFLVDEDTGELVPHQGRDAHGTDLTELTGYGASLVGRVRDTGEPLVVAGTEEAAALGSRSAVLHELRSILVAPLLLEGRLLGVIYLDSRVANGIFSAADLGILTALTNHIATSLETARATQLEVTVQSARQQRDLADTLRRSLQDLSETLDTAEVTRRLLAAAPRIVHCDQAWLVSREDGEAENYTLLTGEGADGALVQHPGLADDALREFFMRSEPWVGTDDDVPSGLAERLAEVTSWVVLPLGEHAGRDLVMVLVSGAVDTHLGDELAIASVLAAQGVAAYDKAALFRRVQELAVTDELTKIANRRSFFELAERDLAAARRHGRALTAVMVDIDHFKRINDVHGHPTGDDVISEVAQRLGLQMRTSDLLGRYGGEEFALLLPDAASDEDVAILPERLRSCIGDLPLPTRSGPVSATISIGVARLLPSDANIGALLARADEALYRAKADGRNCVRLAD